MQVTIENKLSNPLLQRTEVQGTLTFEGTIPSNMDLQQELAKQLSVDVQLIVVKKLQSRFSGKIADFNAVAYANSEAQQKAERMTKHIRKRMAEEAKKKAEEEKAKKEAEEAAKKAEEAKVAEQPEEKPEEPAAEKPVEETKQESSEPAAEAPAEEKKEAEEKVEEKKESKDEETKEGEQ